MIEMAVNRIKEILEGPEFTTWATQVNTDYADPVYPVETSFKTVMVGSPPENIKRFPAVCIYPARKSPENKTISNTKDEFFIKIALFTRARMGEEVEYLNMRTAHAIELTIDNEGRTSGEATPFIYSTQDIDYDIAGQAGNFIIGQTLIDVVSKRLRGIAEA